MSKRKYSEDEIIHTQRVQFDMTQISFDDLKWAKQKLGAVSYAEVIRRILRVFRVLCSSDFKNPRFYVQDDHGRQVEFFF